MHYVHERRRDSHLPPEDRSQMHFEVQDEELPEVVRCLQILEDRAQALGYSGGTVEDPAARAAGERLHSISQRPGNRTWVSYGGEYVTVAFQIPLPKDEAPHYFVGSTRAKDAPMIADCLRYLGMAEGIAGPDEWRTFCFQFMEESKRALRDGALIGNVAKGTLPGRRPGVFPFTTQVEA